MTRWLISPQSWTLRWVVRTALAATNSWITASSVPKNFIHVHTIHRMGLMHVTRYLRKVQQFPHCLVTRAETSIMRHLKLKKYKHPLPGDTHCLLRQVTPSVKKNTKAVFRGRHNGVLLVEFTDRRTQWLLYIIVEYLTGYLRRAIRQKMSLYHWHYHFSRQRQVFILLTGPGNSYGTAVGRS